MERSFNGLLKSQINLLSALAGWDELMDRGTMMLQQQITRGGRVLLITDDEHRPLGQLALQRMQKQFELPSGSEGLALNKEVAEGDLVLIISPELAGEELVAAARDCGERNVQLMVLSGEESWLLAGMANWHASVPSKVGSRVAEVCLLLIDYLIPRS